ncbi:MAG: ATP synthase F1 subunit epsilon [Balneolaceae bacterium]
MSKRFNTQFLTPDGPLFDGEAISVTVPGSSGSFQILHNHAPIVSSLGIGKVVIQEEEKGESIYAVSGGFIEMNKNHLTILAEKAEEKSTIDKDEARKLRDEIKSQLKSVKNGRDEFEVALEVAENRLKIAEL